MAFTLRAALAGSLFGILLSFSLSYFALSIGWVFLPILLTSIFCTSILRSVLKDTTVHEIALAQTVASTAALISGVSAFVFPALLPHIPFLSVSFIILVSGLLGVVFSYEFHEQIIKRGRFVFRDGQEASAALRKGDFHAVRSKLIAGSFSIGALFSFLKVRLALPSFINLSSFGIKSSFSFGAWLSSIPFAGGYLLGFPCAISWFFGSILSYLVLVPLLIYLEIFEVKALAISQATNILGLGVLFGCCAGYFLVRSGPELIALFKPKIPGEKKYSLDFFKAFLPKKRLWQAFFLSFAVLAVFSGMSVPLSFFAVFFAFFAFYLSCVSSGKDSLAFFDVFPFFFVFLAAPFFSSGLVFFTAFIAVCSALAIAFTHNFRAGKVIGTVPKQQFLAQGLGVVVAAVFSGFFLSHISSLGPSLPAPQSTLLAHFLSNGFAQVPFIIGFFVGLVFTTAFFKLSLGFLTFPFALGLFMPFEAGLMVLFGGLSRYFIDSRNRGLERSRLFVSSFALGEAFLLAVLCFLF